jgi:hypothetical protein
LRKVDHDIKKSEGTESPTKLKKMKKNKNEAKDLRHEIK